MHLINILQLIQLFLQLFLIIFPHKLTKKMGWPCNKLLGQCSAQAELDVTYTTELTIPKCLDRGLEHSWPIHKPPRLESSSTRRRSFPALAADMMFPKRVGETQLSNCCLTRHLTTLNQKGPRGVCINGEETPPLHLPLSNNTPISLLFHHTCYATPSLPDKIPLDK